LPPPSLLELTDALVVKDGVRVLDGLSLSIREGEHTAILGPNGAGKTTLINLLTRDDYPFARRQNPPPVRVFGLDRWDLFELRSRLGIITADLQQRFVNGNSMGRISGSDAVLSGFVGTYGFLGYHTVTPAMHQRAAAALASVDAAHLGSRPLDGMSTGEVRRVLVARALVSEPRALVLDEPTAGLDLVARRRFLETVRDLARRGTTIVLVTHHVEEIIPEVEHVILLRRGRVAAAGPKASILTGAQLSEVFGAPIAVDQLDGYYSARTHGPYASLSR
jgi:iron complex transport system ATP-binding protein